MASANFLALAPSLQWLVGIKIIVCCLQLLLSLVRLYLFIILQVWEGEGVIRYGRKLIGATDPQKSEPGTIRGDLAVVVSR